MPRSLTQRVARSLKLRDGVTGAQLCISPRYRRSRAPGAAGLGRPRAIANGALSDDGRGGARRARFEGNCTARDAAALLFKIYEIGSRLRRGSRGRARTVQIAEAEDIRPGMICRSRVSIG